MNKQRKTFKAIKKGSSVRKRHDKNAITEIIAQQIELIPIKRLKLWDKNPKNYTERDVSRLAELYKRHGVSSALVVWKKNMVVYKGNKSLLAARLVGLNKVPCIVRDFPSEAAAHAYGLADNKSNEWGAWNEDLLSELMQSKSLTELGEATGFSERELSGVHDGWDYNPSRVKNIKESEEGMSHTIKIRVPQNFKNDLLKELNTILEEYHAAII